jgi:paraquat-inducible protein B
MAQASVHFWGTDSVIRAYKNRDVAPWSMWQGNQFLFKYEGDDIEAGAASLLKLFNDMSQSTNALYTLRVYEELPKNGKICRTTPDHGSFNFRLNMELQTLNQQQMQSVTNRKDLESELAAVKLELAELRAELDEETDDEPEPDMMGRINGLLQQPAVVGILNKFLGTSLTVPNATIAGVPLGEQSIAESLEILKQHDPKLPDHLHKLALMAQRTPANFSFLLSTLETLQV